MITLPAALEKNWCTRASTTGTVSHNAKAVYQKYMGWYDANLRIWPPCPGGVGQEVREYFGDVDAVLAKAAKDSGGRYHRVAEVTNPWFADPGNRAARLLCADAGAASRRNPASGATPTSPARRSWRDWRDADPKYRNDRQLRHNSVP